ncbi:helix-turn-helix domain-containing protein [Mycobacterium hackensackense]|uniref:helix-turn-helix domain-containing protein n=1 Tax=Mycobacterium hackensackense TaxID=228909 RepID=UPI0022659774|nr:PucR family transcriptional regulator [Mycobacterium hackensackense]MCV7256241.1 helix-turn-helix domain-containing protein [Mycobacterium hackensackense]
MSDIATVRDVLALPDLAGAEILGGANGLDRPAHDAHIIAPRAERTVPEHSVAFLTSGDSLATELSLPGLAERQTAAVIVEHDVLVSTRWLADRFGLPLVRLPADRWETALAVRVHLRRPLAERGLKCAEAAARLALADTPSSVAKTLSGVLGHPVSVLGPSDVVLAGPGGAPNGTITASTPPGREAGARLTCAVHAPSGLSDGHVETIRAVAGLGLLRLSAWAARSSLSAAWDQASQGALLTHLLTTGTLDGPRAEQAVALGWQLEGFHTAVMVRPEHGRVDRSLVLTALQNALVAVGLTVPAVPLAEGWVWWTSTPARPTDAQQALRANEVRQIVADLAEHDIAAGVAGADYGIAGLVRAIDDAARLCRIAGHAPGRRPVETASDANPRQYLLTAVTDEQARQRAQLLLEPLRSAADDALLDTLNVYLLSECSTAAAARRLGVHRNSVLKRLDRIRSLLGVDLDDDDTRLALRIACRAL